MTYHDVASGKVVERSAAEVRREILAAAAGLRALGIQPGDRVAIVGLNSSRYLALDVAVGLLGAVNVPVYYTCPPADVDRILASSGARLLLVGTPVLMARLSELTSTVRLVSFCRGPLPEHLPRRVTVWREFLDLGQLGSASPSALASPEDLATLLYTSGTTGRPKGVVFKHRQIRWMAESLASLLPWSARNAPATYLSFLPKSHVVEGILANYAPYYLPAPVDVYFLEDFKEIQLTLPLARPTIFFSVPRLYEKLLEAVRQTWPGRYCVDGPDGLLKRALRPLVRWMLLRRAGLDRCVQLMVGSGPSSENVLRDLRKVGVEVHNAYGLTEAPLVAMNRLGRNRLGTVGELLPETEVRIAEDGEIMVRGPQVMAGYFDEGIQQPFRDGWLLTGDLGHLTDEGSLVLSGRKKDLIATSYGKKIQPAKVEAMLREIPGVAEAMLVGDGRPYCGALLWTRAGTREGTRGWTPDAARGGASGPAFEALDRAVAGVNARLSHPEQVKSWAVLGDDLSIERGDLTANLKLKRPAIASRLRSVVDALYDGPIPDAVLHLGWARTDAMSDATSGPAARPPLTPGRGSERGAEEEERQPAAPVGAR